MKKILVINGPNLNMLGIREPEIYGVKTYEDLCREIKEYANKINIEVDVYKRQGIFPNKQNRLKQTVAL